MAAASPWYLIFPLAASLLFASGLIVVKKASQVGASTWAVTFIANLWAALLFSVLWPLGDEIDVVGKLWQPGIIAVIYMVGQITTFLAIERGDVSVAAPVLGLKVLMVAVLLTTLEGETLTWQVWLASAAAAVGVALIQSRGGESRHHHVVISIVCALAAAGSFALFDVLVQRWSPNWSPGRLLPLIFWMAGIMTLGMLPLLRSEGLGRPRARMPIIVGGFLIALQSVGIVLTLAYFGDAARVNIVYSLRGLWGVALAWIFASWLGAGELHLPRRVMLMRLVGAVLVTLAVIVAIAARR